MQNQNQLVRPIPWPPPGLDSELPEYTGSLRRVPILNWCGRRYLKWKKKWEWWEELCRVEEEILEQFRLREGLVPEYPSVQYQEIVSLLSEAMSLEKSVDSPVLLPDDELALLVWGAYDDFTFREFQVLFEKKYEIWIPKIFFVPFLGNLDSGMTLNDFVERCLDLLASHEQ